MLWPRGAERHVPLHFILELGAACCVNVVTMSHTMHSLFKQEMPAVNIQCCRSGPQFHKYYKLHANMKDMLGSQMSLCNSGCLCVINVHRHGLLHSLKLVFNGHDSDE